METNLNTTSMKTLHILLVEDNEGDILLTTEAVEDTKMRIKLSVVKDGKEAIDFLQNQLGCPCPEKVSLVLLDINLPKKNGQEVLAHIKGNENLKHIPVVMLTTSSSQSDIDLSRKNMANDYIIKPLETRDLLTVIGSLEKQGI